jgi:hypothetical protein
LTNDISKIGYAEGAQGVARGLVAIPAGLLADRWGSVFLVRVGCTGLLIALLVMLVFINLSTFSADTIYYVLLGCMIGTGTARGMFLAPLFTLFR